MSCDPKRVRNSVNECSGKASYANNRIANEVIQKWAKRGKRMNKYTCSVCGEIHIGTDRSPRTERRSGYGGFNFAEFGL